MKVFDITPTSRASKRTKERIKRNGPTFVEVDRSRPVCFDGILCSRLVSMTTDWDGWIPTEEIITEEKST